MCNIHGEADVIIANQLVDLADRGVNNICVVCDDTDVVILMLHFYCGKNLNCRVIMESPVPGRKVVDTKATANKHRNITDHLPGVHALSGCDTSYLNGIGKATALKVLMQEKTVQLLGMTEANMDDVVSEATSSISRCYSAESDRNMSKQQYEVWLARMAKANICTAPKLKSLPPTAEALVQHVNHAHYQTMIWKSALEMAPPIADLTNYGWPEVEARLLPVMFPQNVALVPDKVLQIIRCGCASTHPCSTAKM